MLRPAATRYRCCREPAGTACHATSTSRWTRNAHALRAALLYTSRPHRRAWLRYEQVCVCAGRVAGAELVRAAVRLAFRTACGIPVARRLHKSQPEAKQEHQLRKKRCLFETRSCRAAAPSSPHGSTRLPTPAAAQPLGNRPAASRARSARGLRTSPGGLVTTCSADRRLLPPVSLPSVSPTQALLWAAAWWPPRPAHHPPGLLADSQTRYLFF